MIVEPLALKQKRAVLFGMAVVGIGLLVSLSLLITRSSTPLILIPFTETEQFNKLITYQLITLFMVGLMAMITAKVMPENFTKYFRIGDLSAPAERSKLLGISKTESWKRIGITFSVIVSAVIIAVVLFPAIRKTGFSFGLPIFGLAILLAASNAFVEEYITRFQVVVALAGSISPARIALISGLLFGIPHYLGNPGGIIGVLLATFLGWLLAKSIIETRGIGWAVFIHFLQDVIIFTAILGIV